MKKLSVTVNRFGLLFLIAFSCTGAHAEPSPNNAEACIERGDYQQAIDDYTKAISLNSNNEDLYHRRGSAYLRLGMRMYHGEQNHKRLDLEQFQKAIDDCNKAISLNSNNAKSYRIRARAFSAMGLFNHVLITQNAGDGPDRKRNYLELYQKSVDDCSKSISLNPNDATSYYTRAGAYKILGEYQKAIDDCGKAISLAPDSYQIYILRGMLYSQLGQKQTADDDFRKYASIMNADRQQHAQSQVPK